MSRQELAEELNAYLWRTHGVQERLDGNDIGKYERGITRWPSQRRREAFRDVLKAQTDVQLGFYINRREREVDPSVVAEQSDSPFEHSDNGDSTLSAILHGTSADRPLPRRASPGLELMAPVIATQIGPPPGPHMPFQPAMLDRRALDWLCGERCQRLTVTAGSHRVDPGEVEAAARQLSALRELDHGFGAKAVGPLVAGFLDNIIRSLLAAGCRDGDTADQIYLVAIGAHELAGYQAVDCGAAGLAQRHYLQALVLTTAAGERAFGAYMLGVSLGHLALHCGHPDRGLRMAQIALKGLPAQATFAVRAALWAVVARANARLGDSASCADALRAAEDFLAASDPTAEPTWIRYLTPAYLADEVAHCMFDLGCHDTAQREVQQAVAGVGAGRVRRLAIDTALLASSLAAAGRVEEACARGRAAADLAARAGSARAVVRVAQTYADLTPFHGTRPVAELGEYIRVALPAAL
ncbi:XRE family transcriptional regulator [Rugosimonospora acidiphila]